MREIRKLAKALGATEANVTMALTLALAVGLVSERTSQVGASDLYRTWSRTEPNVRLAQLVSAWWRLVFIPTLTAKGEESTGAGIVASVHLRDEPLLRQAAVEPRRRWWGSLPHGPPPLWDDSR